jgi:hypothetical protein
VQILRRHGRASFATCSQKCSIDRMTSKK